MSENVKISDLVELGTLQDADELPVVDSSANATKRVTYQTLSSAVLNDIDDLAELTTLAADDVLPVVDASANATKRVTYDTLATEVRTESEPLSATTVTASGDVSADTATIAGDVTSNGETVFHRGNVLGTVSQSGGTPTGAIVERDSNSNGEYVKFADGTMICFANISRSGMGAGTTANGSWDMPATFAVTTTVSHTAAFGNFQGSGSFQDGNAYARTLFASGTTFDPYEFLWKWDGPGSAFSVRISLIAIGRWY